MWKALQSKYLPKKIPIITIHGIIDGKMTDRVLAQLKNTKPYNASSLVVSINSRGGEPIQSHIIGLKLRSYAKQHNLKLYTFATDIAASGGYYILCMGDQVYADRTSLVGNVGVIFSKLDLQGFQEWSQIGINQISSRESTTVHDLFSPFKALSTKDREYVQSLAKQGHQMFKDHVRKYRGNKIKQHQQLIFSAEIFSGEQAKEIGAIDGIGSISEIMKSKQPESYLQYQNQFKFLSLV